MPKGLSVRVRISLIACRVSSTLSGPVARIPNPPASLTAATNLGTETMLIPESTMGCWIPNNSVILVFISVSALFRWRQRS